MADHQTVFNAKKNGTSSGQFVAGRAINVERLVDLLVSSAGEGRHPAIRRAANCLLAAMAANAWRVSAGPHEGGHGGGGQGPDGTLHITVRIDRDSYHLRLDAKGHLFQITGPGIAGPRPWTAPGQPI